MVQLMPWIGLLIKLTFQRTFLSLKFCSLIDETLDNCICSILEQAPAGKRLGGMEPLDALPRTPWKIFRDTPQTLGPLKFSKIPLNLTLEFFFLKYHENFRLRIVFEVVIGIWTLQYLSSKLSASKIPCSYDFFSEQNFSKSIQDLSREFQISLNNCMAEASTGTKIYTVNHSIAV